MAQATTARLFDGRAVPTRMISGPGSRTALRQEVARLALTRVLVVTGPNLREKTPFVREVEDLLEHRLAGVFDRIKTHTPTDSLTEAAEYAKELRPDAVLSLGGGSAHDAAKGIAFMLPSGRNIAELASRFEPPDQFHIPDVDVEPLTVITMPSTYSAAEVVGGGAFTDPETSGKVIFVHPKLTPSLVILDGEIVASTPRPVLLATGMNALHHCLESLYSKGHQPLTDAFALHALRSLVASLPQLRPDVQEPDINHFQEALDGASLSGLAYVNSWLGVGHSICHSLGGRYGLSHGLSNAVILPHSLGFNLPVAADRLALAANATGARFPDRQAHLAAEHVLALVKWLAELLDMPRTLHELGLPKGQFERIAKDVMSDPQTFWNPRQVEFDDVVALLKEAW